MPEYFFILVLIFFVTVLIHVGTKVKIYKSKYHFLIFNVFNLFLATIWDQIAISRGHWSFNEIFLLGPKLGHMPIEEFLFVSVLIYFNLVIFRLSEKYFQSK